MLDDRVACDVPFSSSWENIAIGKFEVMCLLLQLMKGLALVTLNSWPGDVKQFNEVIVAGRKTIQKGVQTGILASRSGWAKHPCYPTGFHRLLFRGETIPEEPGSSYPMVLCNLLSEQITCRHWCQWVRAQCQSRE